MENLRVNVENMCTYQKAITLLDSIDLTEGDLNESLSRAIVREYPESMVRAVMENSPDIDFSFVGFIQTYYLLSKLIPRDWTVLDLGCAYNPQSYLFKNHARLISVDLGTLPRFNNNINNTVFEVSILRFLDSAAFQELNLKKTFAIMNYVPCGDDTLKAVTTTFPNLYVFYPSF